MVGGIHTHVEPTNTKGSVANLAETQAPLVSSCTTLGSSASPGFLASLGLDFLNGKIQRNNSHSPVLVVRLK